MKIGMFAGKFLPLHRGHSYVTIQASNMCDRLFLGLSHSELRDRSLCAKGKMAYVPANIRREWIQMLVRDMPNVEVFDFDDEDDETYDSWHEGATKIRQIIGKPIDYVFGSEPSYADIFRKLYPEAEYVRIDDGRKFFPMSSTRIREEGVFKHWGMLPDVVRQYFVKKICVVGTESCGKSTLVRNLAKTYDTAYVEEFGRIICEEVNGIPLAPRYPDIAAGHRLLVYERTKIANRLLFIDSDAMVTNYYLNLYTNVPDKGSALYKEFAYLQNYDLYIYLTPDVEWIDDGLRDHGTDKQRRENDVVLRELLDSNNIKYTMVGGSYQDRYLQSLELVNKLMEE